MLPHLKTIAVMLVPFVLAYLVLPYAAQFDSKATYFSVVGILILAPILLAEILLLLSVVYVPLYDYFSKD